MEYKHPRGVCPATRKGGCYGLRGHGIIVVRVPAPHCSHSAVKPQPAIHPTILKSEATSHDGNVVIMWSVPQHEIKQIAGVQWSTSKCCCLRHRVLQCHV